MPPIKSEVWEHFSKENASEVKCRLCNKILKSCNLYFGAFLACRNVGATVGRGNALPLPRNSPLGKHRKFDRSEKFTKKSEKFTKKLPTTILAAIFVIFVAMMPLSKKLSKKPQQDTYAY